MSRVIGTSQQATTARLWNQTVAVCPLIAMTVGVFGNSATVTFQAAATATPAQISAAHSLINNFDWSDTAEAAYEDSLEPDLNNLETSAANAIAAINTYLAIPTPTVAQVTAEVTAIDQRQKAIIQALLRTVQRTWK